jgi:hypothetical protein
MKLNLIRIFAYIILVILLTPLCAESQDIKVLVNQAGYDTNGIKRVWLQSGFSTGNFAQFQIVRGDEIVLTGTWGPEVQHWGKWYRVGDFSGLTSPGHFKVRVERQGWILESPPFIIESNRIFQFAGPLAVRFFTIQRCGIEIPGWHSACHLDDGKMPDGSYRDLTGGWHDAGDYNKYNGYTPLAIYALAKFAGNSIVQGMAWPEQWPTPLEEALWGASWIRKAQDSISKRLFGRVSSGLSYWGPPELETDNIPGTVDDRPVIGFEWNENEMATAAFAALYANTANLNWSNAARELWNVVTNHIPANSVTQRAKRLLAAVEIYKITSENYALEDAVASARYLLRTQQASGGWLKWNSSVVDFGIPAAALAEFVLSMPNNELTDEIRNALSRYLIYWSRLQIQPFSVPKWSETNYFYPYVLDEWYIGQNSMYLSQAWAGALLAKIFPQQRNQILRWTQGCLDWIAGANPFGICMMYGAGTHHLARYHHRYETIPNGKNGNVIGAICNGITRESPENDIPFLDLIGNTWQTNEPWLPHNAFFLLTLSQLDQEEEIQKKAKQRR